MIDSYLEDISIRESLNFGDETFDLVKSVLEECEILEKRLSVLKGLLEVYTTPLPSARDLETIKSDIIESIQSEETSMEQDCDNIIENIDDALDQLQKVDTPKLRTIPDVLLEQTTTIDSKPDQIPEIDNLPEETVDKLQKTDTLSLPKEDHKPTFDFGENEEKECIQRFSNLRWGSYPKCPHCKSSKGPSKIIGGYRCSDCDKPFSFKTGTIFQGSTVPFDKWFDAIEIVKIKRDVSAEVLSKKIDVPLIIGAKMLVNLLQLEMNGILFNDILKQCITAER